MPNQNEDGKIIIEDFQKLLQLKIRKCNKHLQHKRKIIMALEKMKHNDELELCGLEDHHHLHPDDPKYQELEQDKYILQENCNNAEKAIKQVVDEEKKLVKELRSCEAELSQLIKID